MNRLDPTRAREIFHLLFLERLLKVSDPALYVLKGGVNLRFFFASPRYSEDMDLDVVGGSVETLRKNGYRILEDGALRRSLASYGITDLELRNPAKAKHTETTQRFRLRLIIANQQPLPTKVEFSRRGAKDDFATESIDPTVVRPYRKLSFPCQHYTGAAAARQKVAALAHRNEVQARDVFDLYVLWLGGHVDATSLSTVPEQERNLAAEQLLCLDYSDYRSQVLDYVDLDRAAQFGSDRAWNQMASQVLELLETA